MIPASDRNLAGTIQDQIARLAIAVSECVSLNAAKLESAFPPRTLCVLNAIPFRPDSVTRPQIENVTGFPTGTVKEALFQLRHKGIVESTARVGNNLSMYWRKA